MLKKIKKIFRKEVIVILGIAKRVYKKYKSKIKKILNQKGQSTIEYALVLVIAGIISAILVAVGKPLIIDVISKVFAKIASMV